MEKKLRYKGLLFFAKNNQKFHRKPKVEAGYSLRQPLHENIIAALILA